MSQDDESVYTAVETDFIIPPHPCSDQPVTLTTVKPHLPLVIKTLELNSGLLRCVRASSEGGAWGSSSYDGYEDRYSTSISMSSSADRYVDLQPDGNSFDLMSGLIKQKV